MKHYTYVLLALLALPAGALADDSYKKTNDKAVDLYNSGEFDQATSLLEEAKEGSPADQKVNYNLGEAYHQQGEYDKANESFLNSAVGEDSLLRANSHYNMGNTEFRKGDYKKAVESYKKSLQMNPRDFDAKYNLELAMKKLQEQEQNQCENNDQQQEDQEQQDKEQQKQDQQQDQEEQDQQDQQRDQQQDQQQQNQDQEDQQKQDQSQQQQDEQDEQKQQQSQSGDTDEADEQQGQEQQPQPMEMTQEDAERLLNAVTGNDKEVLQRLVRAKTSGGGYSGKDW
jgi:Ca-activated chloride channel family protein